MDRKDALRTLFQQEIPFTLNEYDRESSVGRLALLKMMAEKLTERTKTEVFSWEALQKEFDKDQEEFLPCAHQLQTWKTVMEYERQLATLRERMEDLCEEMERVKKGEGRKFILGPGVTNE